MFPVGLGGCPLASGLALLPGVDKQGRVGQLVRRAWDGARVCARAPLDLVLSSCSGVGPEPLLGGSGRR